MADRLVRIQQGEDGPEYQVFESNFHLIYEPQGYHVTFLIGDSEGPNEVAPPAPETATEHIGAAPAAVVEAFPEEPIAVADVAPAALAPQDASSSEPVADPSTEPIAVSPAVSSDAPVDVAASVEPVAEEPASEASTAVEGDSAPEVSAPVSKEGMSAP